MWKLTIEDDEQKQTSLPLVHEEYGVGRAEGNVIRLTDRNVSRKHAILRRGGPGWVVKDLESYNGTYVNGLRVAGEAKVVHGDVVQLGDYRLEFNDEAKSVEAEAARTAVDSNARPPHQRPDRLVVVVGPTPGQEFPLVGDHFTMGRAEDASISINHSSVSRFHAEIFALGTGRYEIIDKGSANGIRVNGHDLKRGIFEAGDAIELGDVRLRFVGAGKIFRAGGFDHRQQIAAVKGFDPVAPGGSMRPSAGKSQSSGLGKWIAIGVGLGLLGVVGALIVLRTGTTETAPPTNPSDKPPVDDAGAAILNDAVALSDKKEHEAAHKKVLTIPEGSAARNDPKFAEVEARWADWMFEKVDKSSDLAEKRTILHEIASTPTVDAARRKKAANMIREMDPTAPDGSATPSASAPGSGAPAPGGEEPPPTPGSPTPGSPTPPGPGNAPVKPPEPTPSASVDPRDQALKAPEATMNALIKKMSAGTASEQELRLLRGLCAQLGNRACWSAASAALKNLENK
jgi:pSer/pThr/pTyr-binding forkhead associated (FHA) protein